MPGISESHRLIPTADHVNARSELAHTGVSSDPFAELVDLLDARADSGLSPEILVAMAGRRLHDIDAQISGVMHDLNNRGSKLAYLRAATEGLSSFREAHSTSEAMNPKEVFVDVALPDGTTAHTSVYDAMRLAGVPESALPANAAANDAAIGHIADTIRTQIDQVNQGADIAQLNLQQLISSRGQVTQTVSQLLAALHENAKAILQNTRG